MSASASASASAPTTTCGPASTAANDAWLESVLANPKNRDNLARLESALVTFMVDTKLELSLPPCSPFQRRVCVEVARRFGLEHRVDRGVDQGHDAVLLVLRKSPNSAIPTTMLSKLRAHDIKPKLVKRPKPSHTNISLASHGAIRNSNNAASSGIGAGTGHANPNSNNTIVGAGAGAAPGCGSSTHMGHHIHGHGLGQSEQHGAIKKVSQEEYEQARARIFNELNGSTPAPSEQASTSISRTPTNSQQVRIVGGGIARGPEAGQSFARRRLTAGLPSAQQQSESDANNATATATANAPEQDTARDSRARARGCSDSNQNQPSPAAAGDKDDPDFDRCYDKWAKREHGGAGAGTVAPPGDIHAAHMMYGGVYGYMPPPPTYVYHIPPPHPHPYYYTTPPHPHHNQQFHNSSPSAPVNVNNHNHQHHPRQQHTPAYGLDDTADFPPLSATNSRKQRR